MYFKIDKSNQLWCRFGILISAMPNLCGMLINIFFVFTYHAHLYQTLSFFHSCFMAHIYSHPFCCFLANCFTLIFFPIYYKISRVATFYTPPLKKCGVLCYTFQKKFAFECPSVRLSVCPSVSPSVRPSAFRFRALS